MRLCQSRTLLLACGVDRVANYRSKPSALNFSLIHAGWTFRRSGGLNVRREGNVCVYGIPYSEHSSWTELRSCVALLRPRRLVPTVSATDPNALRNIANRFAVRLWLNYNLCLPVNTRVTALPCYRSH